MSGRKSYENGLSAEARIARHYADAGCAIAATRWRGSAGEIDLVARDVTADGARVIFIEVKQSDTFDHALAHLSEAQMTRIYGAASEFIGGEPAGQATEVRFDVALVDVSGQFRIIEAAFGL
jgi:putative endonuclease